MKIVVAIKQVPARDSQLKLNKSGTWIEEADLAYEINEPDAYALESGLQLREKLTGDVVVLCAGPAGAGCANGGPRVQRLSARTTPAATAGADDPLAVVHHLEAWMPEAIAACKT